MKHHSKKFGEHPSSDEDGKRNLVEFFRLLHQVDTRLKSKDSHPQRSRPAEKVDIPSRMSKPPLVKEVAPFFESRTLRDAA